LANRGRKIAADLNKRDLPMKSGKRLPRSLQVTILAAGLFSSMLGSEIQAMAQELKDVQRPESSLVLEARGSFFVGGETVEQTSVELGSFGLADQITINQMYVEFMVPDGAAKVPVVMVPGATLSGKTYDTTPDGRMGWFEYFVRQGHPTYVVDQVGRARSGFNQAVFNNVRAGLTPPNAQPNMLRLGDRKAEHSLRLKAGSSGGRPCGRADG
jgi:hypothetical protein